MLKYLICLFFIIHYSLDCLSQNLSLATATNMLNDLQKSGVLTTKGASYFSKNLTDYDTLLYDEGSEEEPQQVYRTFLTRLQAASRGNFTPTSIIDNVVKKGKNSQQYEWGFTLNQKSYLHKATDIHNYLWECQYMKEVKQALLDSKVVGTFYPIGFEGNHFYIFLTPDQYTYLQTNHPDLFEK